MDRSDDQFLWQPGRGCDAPALARMRDAFPLPREPMGEAWFMGKTRDMYDWLHDEPATLAVERAEKALEEIAHASEARQSVIISAQ